MELWKDFLAWLKENDIYLTRWQIDIAYEIITGGNGVGKTFLLEALRKWGKA